MKHRNSFSRILALLLIMLSMVFFTACSGKTGENSETSTQNTDSSSAKQTEESKEEVRILDLDKTVYADGEWADEGVVLLARTHSEQVRLEKECAKDYPKLTEALNELADMQKKRYGRELCQHFGLC